MYSMDKYGRLKKQMNRYVGPLDITPFTVLDAIRKEERKLESSSKARQTLAKLSEEAQKIDALKITGKQLKHNNYEPLPIKAIAIRKQVKKQFTKYNRPFLIDTLLSNIDQQSNNDFSKSKSEIKSQKVQKTSEKISEAKKSTEQSTQQKKMSPIKPISFLKDEPINKKVNNKIKKISSFQEKLLTPIQAKKSNNFIQYRQFLMTVNLSNCIIVHPDKQVQNKAIVCKGNNGLLIKSIVKTRPWWCIRKMEDLDNSSLIWTQWKKNKIINHLQNRQKIVQNAKISKKLSSQPTNSNFQKHSNRIHEKPFLSKHQQTTTKQQHQQVNEPSSTNLLLNKKKINTSMYTMTKQLQNTKYTKKKQPQQQQRESQLISQQQKTMNLRKIIKIQNFIQNKYINFGTQNNYSFDGNSQSYFIFSRRIHEKKFQQIINKFLCCSDINSDYYNSSKKNDIKIYNHIPGCLHLHSKKLLFLNMKAYYESKNICTFDYLPQTYLFVGGLEDDNFGIFKERFRQIQNQKNQKLRNIWICKPGENSNQGYGISVVKSISEVEELLRNKGKRTLIVQKYMENPFLYNRRKFDIRTFLLITTVNGIVKGYWYNDGYLRTASKQYTLKNTDNKFIHLTNDAIQKKADDFGKFQNRNKVSYQDFQKYLEAQDVNNVGKFNKIQKMMKKISQDLIEATSSKLNPKKKQFAFELFGLDFMLNDKLEPFLIEANSNPCLQAQGSVLSKIIPHLLQNTLRIAIDPLFPPPYSENWKISKYSPGNPFQQNKFQLFYDSFEDRNAELQFYSNVGEEQEEEQGEDEDEIQIQ